MIANIRKALQILTYVIIFEVILGGAGRIIAFGPISFRMLLFGITFLLIFILYLYKGLDIKEVLRNNIFTRIILIFIAYILFSAVYGYMFQHHSLNMIIGDVTGYIALLLIFLFDITVQDKYEIKKICSIIVLATSIQSIIIIAIHYIIAININYTEAINFALWKFYIGSLATVYPDSTRIFFKSAIFLQIGFILSFVLIFKEKIKRNRYIEYVGLIFITYAAILTFTRGFWLGMVLSFIILVICSKLRYFTKTIAVLILGLVIMLGLSFAAYRSTNLMLSIASRAGIIKSGTVISGLPQNTEDGSEGQDVSADYRVKMNFYLAKYIKMSPIIGNGLGTILPELNQNVSRNENMYLDIWLEMGIIGLVLYMSILLLVFWNWVAVRKKVISDPDLIYLDALIAALAGVMITTAINPFLNNPLGITYLLCVIASLNVFKNDSSFGKVIGQKRR